MNPREFINSLTTNLGAEGIKAGKRYLAYQSGEPEAAQAEAVTRSQYFRRAEMVTRAKAKYVEPLLSDPLPKDPEFCACFLLFLYTFFTGTWAAGLFACILFVCAAPEQNFRPLTPEFLTAEIREQKHSATRRTTECPTSLPISFLLLETCLIFTSRFGCCSRTDTALSTILR
ncbi:MAG: hypothetical protein P4L51_20335 [Puia sp.]|nr:hypothetical protein [Puia sp.]